MALSATVYRFHVDLSDLDRHYYAALPLTVAQHPSETAQRMLVRVLVYCLCAEESLSFTKGLSTDEEPDLWSTQPDGRISHWIELGTPDLKRIRQAAAVADRVSIFAYGGQQVESWWQGLQKDTDKLNKVSIWRLQADDMLPLAEGLQRSMQLSCIIDEGMCTVSWDAGSVNTQVEPVYGAAR